jgi:hypothetical protein
MSWNDAPKAKIYIGTTGRIPLPDGPELVPTYSANVLLKINSAPVKCDKKMTFRACMAPEVKHGGVEFQQQVNPFGGWNLWYRRNETNWTAC